MAINLSDVKEAGSYEPLPPNKYHATVLEVNETVTKNGDPMWKMVYEIQDEGYEGRKVFDNLVYSTKAKPRLKKALKAMGFDVDADLEVDEDSLEGRQVIITVEVENYTNDEGVTKKRNSIPYSGFEAHPDQEVDADGVRF